jgi:autotransporter-associated beta strand protein
MKPHQTISNWLGTLAAVATSAILLDAAITHVHAGTINWNGQDGNSPAVGNFSYCDNWYGSGCPTSYGGWTTGNDLQFNYNQAPGGGSQGTETAVIDDYTSDQNIGNIYWESTFTANSPITFSSSHGNKVLFNQKVENDSPVVVTITCPLSGDDNGAGHIELNPVGADMLLSGTMLNPNAVAYQVYGVSSHMLTIGTGLGYASSPGNVSLTIEQYSKVKITAAQSWGSSSVGTTISQGELWIDSGGSLLTGSPVNVGQNDGNNAKLWLSIPSGGQTFNNPITVNNQSSSPAEKDIGGLNTSGTDTFGGTVTLNGQVNLSAATGGTVVFGNVISGSSQNVVINGYLLPLSGIIIMSAANTYSGNTYISGGTLQFNSGGSAASSPNFYLGETTGSQTATLTLGVTGGGQTLNNPITVRSGSSGTKTISSLATSGNNTFSGNVSLQTGVALQSASGGTLTLGGIISESSSGVGSVTVGSGNAGTVTLSGNNTYTGGTTISAGNLTVASGGNLGSGSVVSIASAGSLTVNNSCSVAELHESASGNGGTASIGSGAVLTVNGANLGTFYMNTISGSGTLAFSGTGTSRMQLYGSPSCNITVNSGTLGFQPSTTCASPQLSIAAGATFDVSAISGGFTLGGAQSLQGNGTINGAVTVNGTLSPGSSGLGTIGTLSFGSNLTLGSSSTASMEINKASGPVYTADKAAVTGAVTFGGTLNVTANGSTLASGDTFTLLTGSSFTGYFSTVTLPSLVSIGGISWDTNKLATSGVLDIYTFTTTALALSTPTNTAAVISALKLANHASSARGTPVAAAATTPSHGTASVTSGVLTYTPTSGFSGSDSFTVTFQDGHGWQTMAVSVTVGNGTGQGANAVYTGTSGGNFVVNFAGIPGYTYTVQSSSSANGSWAKLANFTAPSDNSLGFGIGVFQVSDPMSNGAGFYRTVYPAY